MTLRTESFAVGFFFGRGGFYLANLAGDWSASRYVDELLNDCPWCECEMAGGHQYKFILVKESEYFGFLNGRMM